MGNIAMTHSKLSFDQWRTERWFILHIRLVCCSFQHNIIDWCLPRVSIIDPSSNWDQVKNHLKLILFISTGSRAISAIFVRKA